MAALGLRFPDLADRTLNIDEVETRNISRKLSWITIGGRPPLSFVLIAGTLKIHDSQVMLLLPAVLFGAATVGLLGWTGRVALGWRVGLLAGLWLLFSPPHIGYSQYARYYAFMLFFSVWSYLCLELWLRMRRRRYLAYWFLASALNLLSHLFAAFIVAFQAAVVLIALVWQAITAVSRERRLLRISLAVGAMILVVAGIWAGYTFTTLDDMIRDQLAETRDWETPNIDSSWAFWRPYLTELTGWPGALLPAALVLLAVAAAVSWQRNKLFLIHTAVILIVPILVVDFVQPRHWFENQYTSFGLPFFLMALAAGVAALWEMAERQIPPRVARWRIVPGALAGLAVLAPLLGFYSMARQPSNRELRDIAGFIERLHRPGDRVLFTHGDDLKEFVRAASPDLARNCRLCPDWKQVVEVYYPRRLKQPFWWVVGRFRHHEREELEWALNNLTHQSFQLGYAFHSSKHLEMDLGGAVLASVRHPLTPGELPLPTASFEAYRFSVYIPRSGHYYVLANQDLPGCMLGIEGIRPLKLIVPEAKPTSTLPEVWLAEGRHDLTFLTPTGTLKRVKNLRLRILPAAGSDYRVNGSAFDIARGYWNYDSPVTYQGRFGIELRLWCYLYYGVFVEKTGRYEFAITADNDRPTTNQIALWVNKKRVHRFYFNQCNNRLETQRTVIPLDRGLQLVGIRNEWYPGVDEVRTGPVADRIKTTFVAEISLKDVTPLESDAP